MPQPARVEIYDELPLPSAALRDGGMELLRAGVIEDELFITARRMFDDPAQWGGVLADVAHRLAVLYAAESDVDEETVAALIGIGFAATLPMDLSGRRPKRHAGKRASAARAAGRAKSAASPLAPRRKPARAKR
jgi:hypothetical protein